MNEQIDMQVDTAELKEVIDKMDMEDKLGLRRKIV
ncbi:hypothetical protein [Mechercharimyces sp. CAU 1602]